MSSDSFESRELTTMRQMAFERAKGELNSILHTYFSNGENFLKFNELLEKFIDEVESSGCIE